MVGTGNMNLEQVKRLRDEMALDIHLAGMEARTRFQELEKAVTEAERAAQLEAQRLARTVDDLAGRLTELRKQVKGGKH